MRASTKDSSSSTTRTDVSGVVMFYRPACRPMGVGTGAGRPGAGVVGRDASWPAIGFGGAAGRRRVDIVDPSRVRDVTSTRPWWFTATWRTMASPSPVPPVSRLRAWCAR